MSGSSALAIYLAVTRLASPLVGMILARRTARGKEDPARLPERLGHASHTRPEGHLVWLHGASVGEAMTILPLIDGLRAEAGPDLSFLVTTGTMTAARRMSEVLPDDVIHQYVPVDTAPAVRRFLDNWQPDLAVWIESELWPRLVYDTDRRAIPMALINARISARSFGRWQRFSDMARIMLDAFDLILAQDEETLDRMESLGREPQYGGNLKSMIPPPGCEPATLAEMRLRLGERKTWLAASTHDGEEAFALEAHRIVRERHPDALLILAPRHPDRGEEVADLLNASGVSWARRSAGEIPTPGTSVWLGDTMGEMGLWYRIAPVTFIGGSVTPVGGHTPFEPMMIGSAVLHGPDTSNFGPTYAALDEVGGARLIADAETLGRQVALLLTDDEVRAQMILDAAEAHFAMKPDVRAIARELLHLLHRRAG